MQTEKQNKGGQRGKRESTTGNTTQSSVAITVAQEGAGSHTVCIFYLWILQGKSA